MIVNKLTIERDFFQEAVSLKPACLGKSTRNGFFSFYEEEKIYYGLRHHTKLQLHQIVGPTPAEVHRITPRESLRGWEKSGCLKACGNGQGRKAV